MLDTLSAQERDAVTYYNEKISRGDTSDPPVCADVFSSLIFCNLPANGEVIDVGCGIGRAIGMLPELGINRYFGIDPAESQIAYCKKTFPQFEFEVNEMRRIGESYPNRFDGFLLLAVLIHIPRTELDVCMRSLRKCLKLGASGFIAFPYSDDDVREYVVDDINCTLFTTDEVCTSLYQQDFIVVDYRLGEGMFRGNIVAT